MDFYISEEVKQLGIKVKGVVIKGLDNKTISKDYLQFRKQKIDELIETYQFYNIKTDQVIEGFYQLHEKVHVKRRKNPPASETLIKLLLKNGNLPAINKVVDIYNILSAQTRLALGAHDITHIDGNISLRLTKGDELFIPLGQSEPKEVAANEYSYIDDSNEIICRLEIRQVNKTKVSEDSQDIFFIVQGNENTEEAEIIECANTLITWITQFCGGEGYIIN